MLSVLPMITPPFVIGLALILLFGRSGAVNAMLEQAFGITPTRWIYGLPGVWLAQTLALTPVAYLVLVGVVEGISPGSRRRRKRCAHRAGARSRRSRCR